MQNENRESAKNSENQGGAGPLDIEAELKKACDSRDAYEIATRMLSMQMSELAAEAGTEDGNFNALIAEIRRLRPSLPQGSPAAGDVHVRVHCSPDASPEVQEALGHAIAGAIKVAREKQKGAEGSVLREALILCAEEAEAAIEVMGPHGELVRSVQLSVYEAISRIARKALAAPRPQEDGPSPATPQAPDLRDSFDAFKERHLSENSYSTDVEPIVIQAMWETWLAATPKPTGAAAPGSQGGLPNAG